MNTRNWYAWLNLMPPKPDDFHVVGDVEVANPGVQAELCLREPQGIDPQVLLLDLHLLQRPGSWPQVVSWTQCRFDRIVMPGMPVYRQVQVFDGGDKIADLPVDMIH